MTAAAGGPLAVPAPVIVPSRSRHGVVDASQVVDVGGFGAGSDETNQIVAPLNYAISDNLYLSGGWRRLYVDYASGGTAFQATLSGSLVGVTWRF